MWFMHIVFRWDFVMVRKSRYGAAEWRICRARRLGAHYYVKPMYDSRYQLLPGGQIDGGGVTGWSPVTRKTVDYFHRLRRQEEYEERVKLAAVE